MCRKIESVQQELCIHWFCYSILYIVLFSMLGMNLKHSLKGRTLEYSPLFVCIGVRLSETL